MNKTMIRLSALALGGLIASSASAGQSGPSGAVFADWITGLSREKESAVGCFRFQTAADQAADGPNGTPAVHWHVMTIASAGNDLNEFNERKALLTIAFLNAPAFLHFTLTGRSVCGAVEVSSAFTGF